MWELGSKPYQSCLCLLLIDNLSYQDNTKNKFDKKSQFETERSLHQLQSLINFVFLVNGKKVVSSILLGIAMKFEIPIS